MKTLETPRLLLRPFQMSDAVEVLEFASNRLTQEFTGNSTISSLEEANNLIKNVWLEDYKNYGYGRYAVIHKEDNKIIGFNGVKFLPELNRTDLGYRFLPEYWGKGIATESSEAIVAFAFNTLKLEEIIGFVVPQNPASSRVLEKLKFTYMATKPYPKELEDVLWYSLKKEAYERQ